MLVFCVNNFYLGTLLIRNNLSLHEIVWSKIKLVFSFDGHYIDMVNLGP